jgi:hypothetical protein
MTESSPARILGSTSIVLATSLICFSSTYLDNLPTPKPNAPPKNAPALTFTADSPKVLSSWVECNAASCTAVEAAVMPPVTVADDNTDLPVLYVLAIAQKLQTKRHHQQ